MDVRIVQGSVVSEVKRILHYPHETEDRCVHQLFAEPLPEEASEWVGDEDENENDEDDDNDEDGTASRIRIES
jgi:hypothetical protein